MRADVVGELGIAVESQAGGGVEADKVGSDRLALAIETAGAQRDPADGADQRDREQDPRIGARALAVEPGAVASAVAARPMEGIMSRRLADFRVPLRLTPAG